jgi:ATP/maltotriose-dependent transcriptional regulator MalT
VGAQGALMRGHEAARRLAWSDAYTALSLADSSSPLAAQDLELLATAALLLGHVEDGLRALQRAHQWYAEGGDPRRAARCAFWLTFHLGARGDVAQASGWFARASRLLEHEQECAEHGYLLISVAFHQLVAGDHTAGRTAAAQAAEIGGRTGDADLVAFARYLQGRALVHEGKMHEGLALVDEAKRALDRFAHGADEFASGDACYQQAEAYRVLGESAVAEDAYQQASRWGRETQPGLALLRLAQGRTDAAAAAIGRAVTETTDRLRRAKLLPAQVEIMLAAGEVQAARDAAAELVEIAGAYGTPALRATADHARGAVLLAEGDARAALIGLRGAWQLWRELQAPYEAARARVLVGLACRQLGDQEAAAMELDAARTMFAQLGAAPDLARVEALARSDTASNARGLTERELQVLRMLATGTTNHAIANELVLSEKTVHRHVSNIFTKLGVSSRAAATAYAYQHRLL